MEILKRLLDGGFAVWASDGTVIVDHDRRSLPRAWVNQIKARKGEILATLARGEELLTALWAAGYWVYLEPRADGAGFFLLPRGQSTLPPSKLEELFALYEANHDDALLTLLLSLPVTADGSRDVGWWNRATEALQSGRLGLTIVPKRPEAEAKPTAETEPASDLGERLYALRSKAITTGAGLLSEDEVLEEVKRRRGGIGESETDLY